MRSSSEFFFTLKDRLEETKDGHFSLKWVFEILKLYYIIHFLRELSMSEKEIVICECKSRMMEYKRDLLNEC